MFIVPSNSETIILEYTLNLKNPENLVIKLYTNDVFPSHQSTEKDFVEPVGGGYSPVNLEPNGWNVIAGIYARAEHSVATWKFLQPVGNIYGYFVTRLGGELMWVERFEKGPFNIKTAGDEIRITPKLSLKNKVDYDN